MKDILLATKSLAVGLGISAIVATSASQPIPNISSGDMGRFAPTLNTNVILPNNGRLEYTSIEIPANVQVTFVRNASNTPVYLLASQDINIHGFITVSGEAGTNLRGGFAGPGGFPGGTPGSPGIQPGDGLGPGAGTGGATPGNGAFGTVPNPAGAPGQQAYGSSLLIPLVGGSGGGGAPSSSNGGGGGGGGGGGAILIASSTRIHHTGVIRSIGGSPSIGSSGAGSGGAVRMLAPVISGNGTVDVSGWSSFATSGHGRISCEMVDRSAFALRLVPAGSHIDTSRFLPMVTPPNLPTLRVIRVGGIAIPADAPANYAVTLPLNAPANQPIVVEASGFGSIVDAEVQVTPLNGAALPRITGRIDNSSVNPGTHTFIATLPANTPLSISAWTR